MKILETLSDLTLPTPGLGKGMQCASGALIGGTVSQSSNSTVINTIAGGIMPLLWNLRHSPRENLAAAAAFSTITHVVHHYVPVHKLVACAVGLAGSFALGLRASKDIFAVSVISTALSYIPNTLENFASMPAAIQHVARSFATLLGGIGSLIVAGLVTRSIICLDPRQPFWVDDRGNLNYEAKRVMAAVAFAMISSGIIYEIDGAESLRSHLHLLQRIGAIGAVASLGSVFLFHSAATMARII